MKSSLFALGALAAPLAFAAPVEKRQNIDPTVLQFALTLEHLENAFYKGALQKFSQGDFAKAGYGADYYNNLKYIAYDEQTHVQFLQSALTAAGVTPNAACTYKFPYTDVASFITLSSVLEGVGTSAYLGAAPLITNKGYLTAAGSILVVEALHTSFQRDAINEVPMANPFGTPIDPTSAYTLAAAFIVSCPQSNAPLGFTAFPSLAVTNAYGTCEEPDCNVHVHKKRDGWEGWDSSSASTHKAEPTSTYKVEHSSSSSSYYHAEPTSSSYKSQTTPYKSETTSYKSEPTSSHYGSVTTTYASAKPTSTGGSAVKSPPMVGSTVSFTAASAVPAGSYLTFVSGLSVTSVAGTINGNTISAAIPSVDAGQTYVFVTKSDVETTFSDAAVLFGPAILEVYPAAPAIDYNQV